MKFVLAPDSFKESMSAMQAVDAMRLGIMSVDPRGRMRRSAHGRWR